VTTDRTNAEDSGQAAVDSSTEAGQYYDQVVAALAGLPPAVRQDLIEDLPDHLAEVAAEVSAEGAGSLRDRLGAPAAYAQELRTAAGLEATGQPASGALAASMAEGLRRAVGLAHRIDRQGGRLVGYPRLVDLLRAIRPGWWVLRGWLAAEFVSGAHDRQSWSGVIPDIGGSWVPGLFLTIAMIAGSVALGRRSLRWSAWAGRAMAAASVLIALWGARVLADNIGGTAYAYSGPNDAYLMPFSDISDVYVYDQAGRLVPGARLFDQNGAPIQLGGSYCADGRQAPGAAAGGSRSYPLCPADPGPFQSGPGPITSPPPSQPAVPPATSAPPAPGAPSTASTASPSSSRPGSAASPTPKTKPTPTTRPTPRSTAR
jgi:hypothetical protein